MARPRTRHDLPEGLKAWREVHRDIIAEQLKPFLAKARRRSGSAKTAECHLSNLTVFCSYLRKLPEEIVKEFKEDPDRAVKVLDDYVTWLVEELKLSPNTVRDYVSSVKRFLEFYEVPVPPWKLKAKVELPRTYTVTDDRAPTVEELRRIVLHASERGKALILLLASSGMRVGEALQLKVKDVDFNRRPVAIYLRPELTKDRVRRWCFISDEAARVLKAYLDERINDPEAWLFPSSTRGRGHPNVNPSRLKGSEAPMSYHLADYLWTSALERAGLRLRDEHGRDVLHLHSLRKFFFTQMLPVLGREVTEALMGHKPYLDSAYRRFTVDQLGELYFKAMDAVTILERRVPEEVEAKLKEYEERLKRYEEFTKRFLELTPEELDQLAALIKKRRVEELTGSLERNGGQGYILAHGEDELLVRLSEGYELVKELSGDRYLLRAT